MNHSIYTTQNDLLLKNLMSFYKTDDVDGIHNPENNLDKMLKIITGESKISLRIVDWFATNYAKKYYTLYVIDQSNDNIQRRFKVYDDYKLKLKAYSKKRFDPFCRWDRISIPYTKGKFIETTIGQLNFFKWALENKVIDYIIEHYDEITNDMTNRLTVKNKPTISTEDTTNAKTRKKREELSISACRSIRKEFVPIKITF
jgi:hypothetical protein